MVHLYVFVFRFVFSPYYEICGTDFTRTGAENFQTSETSHDRREN